MTALDDLLPGEITAVLAEFGVDTVFTVTPTTYTPGSGEVTEGTPVPHTVKGSPLDQARTQFRHGEVIQDGMAETYIAGENIPFTPDLGIKVTQGSSPTYVVMQVIPLRSGELVAAYRLILKQQGQ